MSSAVTETSVTDFSLTTARPRLMGSRGRRDCIVLRRSVVVRLQKYDTGFSGRGCRSRLRGLRVGVLRTFEHRRVELAKCADEADRGAKRHDHRNGSQCEHQYSSPRRRLLISAISLAIDRLLRALLHSALQLGLRSLEWDHPRRPGGDLIGHAFFRMLAHGDDLPRATANDGAECTRSETQLGVRQAEAKLSCVRFATDSRNPLKFAIHDQGFVCRYYPEPSRCSRNAR